MLHPPPHHVPIFPSHRLANCSLSEPCWDYLSDVLRRNKTLSHLDIGTNDLKDEGLKILCEALSLPDSVLKSLGWVPSSLAVEILSRNPDIYA